MYSVNKETNKCYDFCSFKRTKNIIKGRYEKSIVFCLGEKKEVIRLIPDEGEIDEIIILTPDRQEGDEV